ncbi:ras-related and estrogen-regulated growth inhibitor-like [Mizuhopecten yessoensis]|uniref:small monomeric GTPase n=1 Tax=Mizuhopecten yessoensis TaxID=6573 RepID=A0A210PRP2_MIZYE|nr:ras-related and estrogen-regulated growth inhibitor-like [Mizuhopecten yessoensis]OWF39159.1 Ras-related and estrogen-regulated growth inhibitor [Mizuhopecten yessoensis]
MSQKKFTNAKIVIFGASGVGKTAFAVRYITRRYIGDYDRNKEMLYTYKMTSPRDEVVTLEILDTAPECSPDDTEKNLKWADGYVMMYSVTDTPSFHEVKRFKDILFRLKGNERPMVLIANKLDLRDARAVSEAESTSLAHSLECPLFELSVADGYQGVADAMEELIVQLRRDFVKCQSAANVSSNADKPRSKLYNMKKVLKKRIGRSHSDTF